MTRIAFAICALLCAFYLLPAARASERPCEKQTGALMTSKSSWNEIYRAAVALPSDCFEGYFGEGISDVLIRKLRHDWPGFLTIMNQHPEDKRFFGLLLKSINATLNPDDIVAVYKQARTSCPATIQPRCDEITARSKAALADYDPPIAVPPD